MANEVLSGAENYAGVCCSHTYVSHKENRNVEGLILVDKRILLHRRLSTRVTGQNSLKVGG